MTGSRISKEDWWSGLVRKARQNYSGRESVEVSLCSHTPGAQNSTKHFQNAVIWRVFRLIWGGKLSVLIRSCFWRCCSSKLYRMCSFWSWWPTAFFCLQLMYLLTTAFTIQTKTHRRGGGLSRPPNQPWMTLTLRLTTHKHTPLCIHYGFEGKMKGIPVYFSYTEHSFQMSG